MKSSVRALVLTALCLAAPLAAGCASGTESDVAKAARDGLDITRTLKSYHVVQSAHSGPVGFLKVFDVQQGGGAIYTWKYVYDKDYRELGWVNQMGQAFQWEKYPPGAMPNPREPYRVRSLPVDSIERNTMRMLGIDPALDEVTFPVALAADIR